jgi:hypothetical protein
MHTRRTEFQHYYIDNKRKGRKQLLLCLSTEAIQGTARPLERIDDVKSSDGFAAHGPSATVLCKWGGGTNSPLGMLSVSDGVTNHVLQENLENAARLFVNKAGDTFDSTTTSETTDSLVT